MSLDIITGPMYSGKTTEIFRKLIIYRECKMNVLYINTILDKRAEECFSTHNETIGKIPFDCVKLKTLSEADVGTYDVIAIDEAQFFEDLKEQVLNWVDKLGKNVIVAGLNGDFLRRPFGHIIDLFPYCDTITKLTPFCSKCIQQKIMKPAHFTKRTVPSQAEILIGGKEAYIPVCRQCYLN